MQRTILTRIFSRAQFLIWGLLAFGMLSFNGNANGQCATVSATFGLENASFEDGTNSWDVFFNGAFVDNTNANTGISAARLIDVDPNAAFAVPGFFQTLPAVAGETWTASFEILMPSSNPLTNSSFGLTQIVFRDAGGGDLLVMDSPQVNAGSPTDVYQTVSVTATAPAGTATVSIFGLLIDFPGGTGELFYDDASLTGGGMDLCGMTITSVLDNACNLPFVNIPQLTVDAPAGCTVSNITNDFNNTDDASGVYPAGTTVVTFTATDNVGVSTCAITVDVQDMTPPTVDCGGVFNPTFENIGGWPGAGGNNPSDGGFGSDLPDGSGAPMAVLFNGGQGFGVLFQGGIPSFPGEEITAGFSGFLPGDFAGSGSYGAIKFEFYDAGGVQVGNTGDIILFTDQDPTGIWESRTATVTAPPGTATVTLVPVFVGQSSALLLDDVVYLNSTNFYQVNNNNEDCVAMVDLFEAQATDACGAVTITNDFNGEASADGLYPLGTTVVTTTYTDEAGNTASCVQTVVNSPGGLCAMADITDPCVCLDNATNDTDGQFGELVEVNGSTGGIWTVTASNGLYVVDANDASVQATPGVVYPLVPVTGVQLVENPAGSGVYQLAGVHVDAVGYSVTVTNLFTGQDLTIGQTCNYPAANVTGLDATNGACLADGTFDFAVAPNAAGQLDVTVDGASAFSGAVAANSNNPISVDVAALGTGTYTVQVSFDADDAAAPNPGCAINYDYTLTVGEPQGTLTCNDNVQVSLDENCEVALTADMILEGSGDTGAFNISIAGVTGSVLNGSHIGNTYTVTVADACGNNSCWATVSVEDKLAPTIACLDVVTVCTEDINNVAQPVAFDNCDPNPTVTLIENVLGDDDACDDNQVVFVQTYVAVDAQGNTSTPCQRSVAVVRPTADLVNFPDDLVWSCEQYAARPYIIDATRINPNISNGFGSTYPLFDNSGAWNLTTIPVNSFLLTQNVAGTDPLRATGSGIPTEIDGIYCQYGYTWADQVLETCGFEASTDAPVFKIVRTWTVLDWCTGQIVTGNAMGEDNVQTIKVIDVTAPVISGTDLTVSANIPGIHPQPCKGQGPVDMATATDNCTGSENVQGFIYSDITLNAAVAQIDTNTGLIEPALPVGCYFLVWTAEDACGNVGQSTTYDICIEDNVAPVAVCDEITQVALSSDGLAVVNAETFDDGSYDNCCLDHLEVRRMGQTCGIAGNTTFDGDRDDDEQNGGSPVDPQDANNFTQDPDGGAFVTFCCSDIGEENMVVLRAYDCEGNYNECMVVVEVEDKLAPTIVCPANATLTCDEYQDDLEAALLACTDAADEDACRSAALTAAGYGDVTALDNCSVETTATVNVNTDQCGAGTITRSFTGVDPSDNASNVCTQVITITNVSDWVVEFPMDQDGFCDQGEPEFGEPEIFFESCELIATSFEDEFFDIVSDACFKIVRQWTVINWCVVGDIIDQEPSAVELSEAELVAIIGNTLADLDGDGDRDTRTFRDSYRGVLPTSDDDVDADNQDGFITYQQIIKIQDFEAPVIDEDFTVGDLCIITGNDGTDADFSDCLFTGVLPTPNYDDCILDVNGNLDSNGEVVENALVITAEVFDAAGNLVSNSVNVSDLEIGCYVVRYLAVDRCGNSTATDFDFCVEDCKLPTPYCVQGLVIELMAINDPNNTEFFPMVSIWASDFDAGSFDNCDTDVDISFSTNPLDTGLVFTCNGFLGDNVTPASGGSVGAHLVQIYVTDDSGNQSFCETVVQVQANQNQCDNGTPLVAGTVETEENAGVENVEMNANGNGINNMLMTDVEGVFNMNMPQGGDYTLVPEKDVEPLNGVSTFDLVKISKHILNIESLDSPYKMIAADINNSQSITTLDLVKLRRMILLIDTEFSNNTSWRFVDAAYTFPNPANPWVETFPEIININNLDADMMNGNFVAVKIGDINASAETNNLLGADDRTAGDITLTAQSAAVKAGETVRVDFTANDFMALGMQFTLNFNQAALDFVAIENGVATDENFGLTLLDEGAITFSWNTSDAVRLTNNEVLFTLVFNGNTDAQISDLLTIDSKYITAEAYNANEEILDVNLNFNGTTVAGAFELHQNRPNPFSDETTISFNLPAEQNATITISDLSGKVLKVIQNNFAKGYNEINLAKADLNATGVLYYTLATSDNSSTKMMVLMK